MPVIGYKPKPENSIVVECKQCGMRCRVLKAQKQTMRIKCRGCGSTRFRTVKEDD